MSRYAVHSKNTDSDFKEINYTAKTYAVQRVGNDQSVSWRHVNEVAASDEEGMSLSMIIADAFPENRADPPEPSRKF